MGLRDVEFSCEETTEADPESVWSMISSWERMPEFWKGMREIRKIGVDTFQVRFAFPGNAIMRLISDTSGMSVTEDYLKGPFRGTKTTMVNSGNGTTLIRSVWDVSLSPMLMLASSSIRKHFTEGTQNALRRIRAASEGNEEVNLEE